MQEKNLDNLWRLYNLIAQIIALPAAKRKSFLLQESKEDEALRNQVLEKIENGDDLSRFQSEIISELNLLSDSTTLPGVHRSRQKKFLKDANHLIGKTILNYEITKIIGYGGMGVVYQGRDTKLGRNVALKFLSPRLIENKETKERFLNEARAASQLDHQNIGVIHEICDTEDQKSFIVMALYDGETLKDKLTSQRLSPQKALNYAIQIADGLRFSHQKGIIHRDIKPSNIIVTPDDQVKIVDFGLASFVDRPLPDESRKIMGTMGYMAPEQRQGLKTDFRTDIWSLGVILHEMLLGKRPEMAQRSFRDRSKQEPVYHFPFRSLNTRALSKILTKALQSDPGKRYTSTSELLSALKQVSPAHQSGPFPSSVWNLVRSPYSIAAVIITLIGVVSLLLAITPFSENSDAPPSIGIQLLGTTQSNLDSQAYLNRGATQEIIHNLTQFDALRVVSLLYLDELNGKPEDFANKLGLSWVTFGTIQKTNERIRILLEVHDTATNEVVAVIDEQRNENELQGLLYDISVSLIYELSKEEKFIEKRVALNDQPPDSIAPEAYDAYLQGRYHFRMETPDHLEKAIDRYDDALLIDPSFARAYASKVVPTYLLGDKYGRMPSDAAFYLAKDYVDKALTLNNELPEAYIAQGIVRQLIDNDFESAQHSFQRAIELNPQESEAYREYGLLLLRMGEIEEGLIQLYQSKDLDPTSLQINRDVARAFYYNKEYSKAIDLLNEVLALQPGFVRAYGILAYAYLEMGNYQEAEKAFEELQKHDKSDIMIHYTGFFAELEAAAGNVEKALDLVDEMLTIRETEEPNQGAATLCVVYARLGDKERTRYWFEQALDEGDLPPSYKVDPRWDAVRILIGPLSDDEAIKSYELTAVNP
ncbi:MAG: protein kinase [Rhodothermaceae bacterium]|nr:protein kinase [Rhodothermaceae bacterium]